ncbi:MAG: branched-chain amino acid ABC transporter permease [Clostridiales bacterium]|nr:branched-chain amino acid ABC transporter permease [Clostridiales bacterium]
MDAALIQSIIQGLLMGGLYAAVGLGMSMIFGIVRITNLAHGDFLILACYISLIFMGVINNPIVTLVFVVPIMFFIGFSMQRSLLNRVIGRGDEPPLLITFGLSIIVQNLLLYFFTADAQRLHSNLLLESISLGERVRIPVLWLISCIVGVAIILVLGLYMKNTYMGRAIRATSDDTEAAQLVGVNIKSAYGIAMGIAMMTAAVSGVFIGMVFTFYPSTGPSYLIIAFAVVVIGGIGSIYGTLAAGLIFGLAQVVGGYIVGPQYQQLIGYVILLIMLVLRPQGLFQR